MASLKNGLMAAVCGLFINSVAFAGSSSISYDGVVPLTPTNSVGGIDIPKFDPSIGMLESVSIALWGYVEGMARFESFNATPRTVTMNLAARIELKDDGNGNILSSTLPLVTMTDNATAYDDILDFGGTSGRTYANLAADASAPLSQSTDPVVLAHYSGMGQLHFPVAGTGSSFATGPGNIVYQFSTATSAWLEVTYNYSPVPEPASLGLLAGGLLLFRRRR